MNAKVIGALVGLVFGLAILHYGLIATVFILVCALAGWWIGRIVEGEISLAEILDRFSTRDRI
jgi:uncharacterized membrane protein